MTINKDDIKKWVKDTNRGRVWLAEQLGVEKRTIDTWLSTAREIPKKAMIIVEKLMSSTEDVSLGAEVRIPKMDIVIKIPHKEFVTYSNYAAACGLEVEDFILYTLQYAGDHKDQIYNYIDARKSFDRNSIQEEEEASGS